MTVQVVLTSVNGHVATSPDGTTWTIGTGLNAISTSGWNGIAYSPSLGLYVAVNGANASVATSPDGLTWTNHTGKPANMLDICWSPDLGVFCAVGSGGGTVGAATSPDGVTWTTHNIGEANTWAHICWSPAKSLFCIVSVNGTHQIATSPDGATWTLVTPPMTSLQAVAWDPILALFCVSCFSTNKSATSPDGVTWTAHSSNTPLNAGNHTNMCALNGGGFLVVMGAQSVATSADGSTWTTHTYSNGAGANVDCCAYVPNLSIYVVGCNAGSGDGAMTSPDASTWTPQTGVAGSQVYTAIAAFKSAPVVGFIHSFGTAVC